MINAISYNNFGLPYSHQTKRSARCDRRRHRQNERPELCQDCERNFLPIYYQTTDHSLFDHNSHDTSDRRDRRRHRQNERPELCQDCERNNLNRSIVIKLTTDFQIDPRRVTTMTPTTNAYTYHLNFDPHKPPPSF
jgi:hypothetical protein